MLPLSLLQTAVTAEIPEEKGLAIAQEADKRDTGFSDFIADMLMILKNRRGQKSERKIRTRTLEVKDDGDKSLYAISDRWRKYGTPEFESVTMQKDTRQGLGFATVHKRKKQKDKIKPKTKSKLVQRT